MSYTYNTSKTTPNKTPRYDDIWAGVIHSCEGQPDYDEQQSSLPYLCNPNPANGNPVSSDYYVTREGVIYQLAPDNYYTWHAGDGMISGVRYPNTYSKGVELEHSKGTGAYPKAQMDALTWLMKDCIKRFNIAQQNIVTHRKSASAVGRTDKTDPTDWSDTDFYNWVASLYATDPLRAKTIPGIPNTPAKYTTVELYNFYYDTGGLKRNGYPLCDAFNTPLGIVQVYERTVGKQSATYGLEYALIQEAIAQNWLKHCGIVY